MKEVTKRLYKDIRAAYDELSAEKEFGAQKYSDAYIVNRLAHRFYRSPKTIENIIFHLNES